MELSWYIEGALERNGNLGIDTTFEWVTNKCDEGVYGEIVGSERFG